ncbi:MAG: sigma-70 family RNA polymerase sigma factor [Gammaproteobacteria bacterium]|nr:sigma-70 family RNA polymerase sigma factor [Gammaproteobacteria bacterium]
MADDNPITQLLQDWRSGDPKALNELMPMVHSHLRQLANNYMRGENAGHTLQATALVNEAFLKLVDASVAWQNRAHFIAIAARAMRQILIDHAKSKKRQKRGGDDIQVTLHEANIADNQQQPDLLDIEDALNKLEKIDERKAQIIELSFFGGMTYEEIAEALSISEATVDRELRFSKAWLQRELSNTV